MIDLDEIIWFHQQYHGTWKNQNLSVQRDCAWLRSSAQVPHYKHTAGISITTKFVSWTIQLFIILESGFAVLQGVLEMEQVRRVYGQSLVKNRGRYWPKGVPGDMIDAYFKESPLITAKPLRKHWTNIHFLFIAPKVCITLLKIFCNLSYTLTFNSLYTEEKYVNIFMSSFGCLNLVQHH